MSGRKREVRGQYGDDDGRTIADMSGIGRPGFFGRPADSAPGGDPGWSGAPDPHGNAGRGSNRQPGDPGRQNAAQNYEQPLTKKERLLCALGALKAALLIGLAYIVGLGLVILALIALWR